MALTRTGNVSGAMSMALAPARNVWENVGEGIARRRTVSINDHE
jgi:hypothetical protein